MAEVPVARAATVLVLRDGAAGLELLLVQRAATLAFHGGAWVFPGGRVDPGDGPADELQSARGAAVREAREEAGLMLAAEQLVPLSHWTTPPGRPRRFATWFFAVALPSEAQPVVVDGGEIRAHRWLTPEQALAARAAGQLELPPPTFVTLSTLCNLGCEQGTMGLLGTLRSREPARYVPRPQAVQGGVISLYFGDVAYDGGELTRSGPRHRLHMLESGWHYERSSALG